MQSHRSEVENSMKEQKMNRTCHSSRKEFIPRLYSVNNRTDFQVIYIYRCIYSDPWQNGLHFFLTPCSTSYLTLIVLLESVLSIFFRTPFRAYWCQSLFFASSKLTKDQQPVKSYKWQGDLAILASGNNSSLDFIWWFSVMNLSQWSDALLIPLFLVVFHDWSFSFLSRFSPS